MNRRAFLLTPLALLPLTSPKVFAGLDLAGREAAAYLYLFVSAEEEAVISAAFGPMLSGGQIVWAEKDVARAFHVPIYKL